MYELLLNSIECYPSCYNCSGPLDNDCTECGDPNVYHKELIDKKCVCAKRTIEFLLPSGLSRCDRIYLFILFKACHPKCEKCQIPDDNSTNQYCTMCIQG